MQLLQYNITNCSLKEQIFGFYTECEWKICVHLIKKLVIILTERLIGVNSKSKIDLKNMILLRITTYVVQKI